MRNQICPVCGTGSCKFRNGIICNSWVCAEGLYKGPSGNKGIDKLNNAYHQSDIESTVMDFFNNAVKKGSSHNG